MWCVTMDAYPARTVGTKRACASSFTQPQMIFTRCHDAGGPFLVARYINGYVYQWLYAHGAVHAVLDEGLTHVRAPDRHASAMALCCAPNRKLGGLYL